VFGKDLPIKKKEKKKEEQRGGFKGKKGQQGEQEEDLDKHHRPLHKAGCSKAVLGISIPAKLRKIVRDMRPILKILREINWFRGTSGYPFMQRTFSLADK